jgi:endonuclease III
MIEKIIGILESEAKSFGAPVVNLINFQTNNPDKVLISSIISTRTKDNVTLAASKRLFSIIEKIADLDKLEVSDIEKLIYPAGFYKTKARHLKELGRIGRIPNNFEELIKLPGVGRKVANLYLSVACNKDAITVDTHVHRISNRLGWVKSKNVLETERQLMELLTKMYWKRINWVLVAFGQNVCTPRNPKCNKCAINKYCKKVGVLGNS